MYAVNGLINGNTVVTNENLTAYDGRKVIITILDDIKDTSNHTMQKSVDSVRKNAARTLSGIWKSRDNGISVDEMVRELRKGRQFDY